MATVLPPPRFALCFTYAMCDFAKTVAKIALTLARSQREREPAIAESPSPWGEGLG